MKDLRARFAHIGEAPRLAEWLHANRDLNRYDPEIFSYDSTRVLAVDLNSEPILYLPYMLTIFTEALAPKPGLSKSAKSRGLKAAIHEVVRIAKRSGIGEIYFAAGDEETAAFAEAHGYERLPFTLMRLKPKNVNPPLPEDAQ